MALWQIELLIETDNGDPNKWDWDSLLHTYDGDEIIEIKAKKLKALSNDCLLRRWRL
tara:strand:- start:4349 stop:4519 length:171 start_codon:yes stop_codon:yes gene_type:complete